MIDLSARRKYLSYGEAIKTFDEKDLLLLLKEGTIKAQGQLHNLYPLDCHPADWTPISLPNPSEIPVNQWRDSGVIKNKSTGSFDLVSNTHENYAYQNIEIETATIIKVPQNKGGRPSLYKWDTIFEQIVENVYNHGLPENYNQWSKKLREELPYLRDYESGGPDDKTLKDRLQPLYNRLKSRDSQ